MGGFPIEIMVKFNKKLEIFTRKRKKIPIICQKIVKFHQEKNHWFLAHHLKRSWVHLMWFMGCTRFLECTVLGTIPGFLGFSWSKKTKHFSRHKKHTWFEVFNKICGNLKTFPDKEGVSGSLLNELVPRQP
jgi:hypothetical protein